MQMTSRTPAPSPAATNAIVRCFSSAASADTDDIDDRRFEPRRVESGAPVPDALDGVAADARACSAAFAAPITAS